jgi:hypothetical protein
MSSAASKWRGLSATGSIAACAAGIAGCGVGIAQPIGAAVSTGADAQASGAQTDGGVDTLSEGLVAYWKLDETDPNAVVVDSTGNGHSGVTVNAPMPSTSVPPTASSSALSRAFDGTSQYIVVAGSQDMNFSGETTLAAWVNVASTTTGCHYIVAHGYCWTPPGEVALRIGAPGCGPGADGADHYWAAGSWVMAEHSAVVPLYDYDYNVWVHIAGVYDGQTWILYRDGEEIARQDSTVGAVPVDSDWSLGARALASPPCVPAPAERYFDGLIAEVRVYSRALSAAEIFELSHR